MSKVRHVLKTIDLSHSYDNERSLTFPDLQCDTGDHLLITGKSGVGKTTLLHLLGGLRSIVNGKVWINGQDISDMDSKKRDSFRGEHIGFVFQQPSFIQSLNVFENVLANQYFGKGKLDKALAERLLGELGLLEYRSKSTNELSGGERQRLAIARALSTQPELVLADEPTSSLDDENAIGVLNLLLEEAENNGATMVVVTHDGRLKSHFKNAVAL